MKDEMPLIPEGTILDGDFEVGQKIGGGGFGHIYEAYQLSLDGRKVAIKVERFNPNWQNDASVLARINAKHFLPEVYKKFELRDREGKLYVCLVMQYIEGETMERIVRQLPEGGRISLSRIVKWMTQLCEALAELHSKNIIHADVKPSNIMIDEHDNVCLIDFNTAIINGRIGVWGLCTSKRYSPPEQYSIRNSDGSFTPGTIDETSDIYTAGGVLYYLLFNRNPQTSESRTSRRFVNEVSGKVKDYAPFYQVVEKAAALRPADRYKSANDFRAAIKRAEKRVLRMTTKMKVFIVAAMAVGVVAVTGIALFAVRMVTHGRVIEAGAFSAYTAGSERISAGDFSGAEAIFIENIEKYGEGEAAVMLYALQAEALCENGEYERFLDAYALYPEDIKDYKGKRNDFYALILFYVGEAHYYLGENEDAIAYYTKASETDTVPIRYKVALMNALAVARETDALSERLSRLSDEDRAQIGAEWLYFYDGVAKKAAKDYAAAEENFWKAVATRDEQLLWAVVYECASMFHENGEDEKQIQLLEDKRTRFSSASVNVVINEWLGESYRKLGQLDNAVVCFEYLVEKQPYSYRAHELLARVYAEVKRFDDELAILDKMIELSPQNVRAYTLYVGALLMLEDLKPHTDRDYEPAYEMFKKAEAIDTRDADVVIYRDVFENLKLNGVLT